MMLWKLNFSNHSSTILNKNHSRISWWNFLIFFQKQLIGIGLLSLGNLNQKVLFYFRKIFQNRKILPFLAFFYLYIERISIWTRKTSFSCPDLPDSNYHARLLLHILILYWCWLLLMKSLPLIRGSDQIICVNHVTNKN